MLSKRTYLCASDYDESYFSFDCLKQLPPSGSEWYTICGVPFPNHVEYILVVAAECFLGLFVYFNILYYGGRQPGPPKISMKARNKRD